MRGTLQCNCLFPSGEDGGRPSRWRCWARRLPELIVREPRRPGDCRVIANTLAHSVSLWTLRALDVERKTFGFDSSGGEVGDEPEEMNCFSSQQHCRGDFTGLLFICIYLFIFYLLVVPIEWMIDRRTIRMQVQLDQPSHVVSSPDSHLIRDSCIFYSLRLLQWFKVYKVSFQRS